MIVRLLNHVVVLKRPFLCVTDASVFYGPALALKHLSAAFCMEWTSLTRWSWVTIRFQAAMSDSISSRLLVGRLFNISKATLCLRFSIGFRFGDWVQCPEVPLGLPFGDQLGTMTWRIVKLTSPQILCEWWEKCTVVGSLSTVRCRCLHFGLMGWRHERSR